MFCLMNNKHYTHGEAWSQSEANHLVCKWCSCMCVCVFPPPRCFETPGYVTPRGTGKLEGEGEQGGGGERSRCKQNNLLREWGKNRGRWDDEGWEWVDEKCEKKQKKTEKEMRGTNCGDREEDRDVTSSRWEDDSRWGNKWKEEHRLDFWTVSLLSSAPAPLSESNCI